MSDRRAEAVQCAADIFGISDPVIYYPACGGDRSLEAVGEVLYVDPYSPLQDAVRADAHTYTVPQPVDITAFFDAGLDAETTLTNVTLNSGGLVVWRSYNEVRPQLGGPALSPDTLVGVIKTDPQETTYFDSADLESYFRFTALECLNPSVLGRLRQGFAANNMEMPADPQGLWRQASANDLPFRPMYERDELWEVFVFRP